jgi:hypothetical protein
MEERGKRKGNGEIRRQRKKIGGMVGREEWGREWRGREVPINLGKLMECNCLASVWTFNILELLDMLFKQSWNPAFSVLTVKFILTRWPFLCKPHTALAKTKRWPKVRLCMFCFIRLESTPCVHRPFKSLRFKQGVAKSVIDYSVFRANGNSSYSQLAHIWTKTFPQVMENGYCWRRSAAMKTGVERRSSLKLEYGHVGVAKWIRPPSPATRHRTFQGRQMFVASICHMSQKGDQVDPFDILGSHPSTKFHLPTTIRSKVRD